MAQGVGEFEYVVLVGLDGTPYEVGASSGGVSQVDNSAFDNDTDSGTPVMGYVGSDAVTAGRVGVARIQATREWAVSLYDASGNQLATVPVSNAGLTELAAAINGSSQMDVNIAASGATVPVSNAGLTELAAAINASSQMDVNIAANGIGLLTTTAHDAAFGTAGTADSQVRSIQGIASMTPVQISDGGNVITVDGSGSAGSAASGVVTIQGVASMTPVQVGDNSSSLSVDWNGTQPVTGSGTATGALRVELPTNGTGVLATVGTVTTVSTVSALGTGTTGPMKAEDVGHNTGDMGIPAWGVRQDSPNATAAATGDYHYLATDMVGGIRTALYETDFAVLGTKHVKKYYTNAGAVTDGIVWSPASGTRWYVTDLIVNVSAAATVTFEDDLSGGDSAVMKFEFAANSGVAHHFQTPLFSGEDAADLIVTTSAGNVYITVTGYEI